MRFSTASRLALLLTVPCVVASVAGCASSSEGQVPDDKVAMQTQLSIQRIQNDPKISPQAKQQMIATMTKNAPGTVKVEIQKQQADPQFQQVQNDPNLSPTEKQRVLEQSLSNRQASSH